jgi:GNAT superfamily N-acetyltransferase
MQIERASAADAGEVLRLIRALAEYEKLLDKVVATEELLRQTLFGADAVAETLLCRVERRAVGVAIYFRNYSTFRGRAGIYLEDLFVEPGQRGRGYGRALLQAVAQRAVERGCERMEWSVLDWNTPSIEFYKSFGAQPLDDWTIFRLSGDALRDFAGRSGT